MATSTSWLGTAINFDGVEDKTSTSAFELLPQGFYKAKVKNVEVGVLGAKNTPALTVCFEIEGGGEMSTNYFIPQKDDSEDSLKFKKENLKNFLTRTIYSNLTGAEFKKLDNADVDASLKALQKSAEGPATLIGKQVLIDIRQNPFIAKDKATGAIKFFDISKATAFATAPKQIVTLIEKQETASGVSYDQMPNVLFSNGIAAHGLGFYGDYDESKEKKNSKGYEFIQSLRATAPTASVVENNEPFI